MVVVILPVSLYKITMSRLKDDCYDIAGVLVKSGADVNGDKYILLRLAKERPKIFNELITEAVDVNILISTNVFLDLVEKGFTESLKVLLKKGYEINRFNFLGFNALTNYVSKAWKMEKTMVMLLFAPGEDVTCQKPIHSRSSWVEHLSVSLSILKRFKMTGA